MAHHNLSAYNKSPRHPAVSGQEMAHGTHFLHARVAVLSGILLASSAQAQSPDDNLHDWQVRRLMEPSTAELQKERSGNVYIYDGLDELEVERALNTHFDRIEHMMFVGTMRRSPDGGTVVESGGCGGSN